MILFLAATVLTDCGDFELFYELFDKYKSKMHSSAYAVLRDTHLAEDAVSEALMRVLRNFETVKSLPAEAYEAYFIKCARNSAIDIYRKSRKRMDNEIPLEECVGAFELWDSTFGAVSRIIDTEAVKRALNNMEPYMRNLIVLCIVDEKSVTEAARLLGAPRTTVEYRLHKAKECFAIEYLKITGEVNE